MSVIVFMHLHSGAITLHTNAGAIAGVVGSTVTILLALLG
jgi:hypothetical protein